MAESFNATLRAAAAGDAEAWRVVVETYAARVYAVVFRQCGDSELAEEITQATFAKAVEKLPRYEERGKFEPWLFRIAINRLRDELRRRQRQATPVDFDRELPEKGRTMETEVGPLDRVARDEEVERMRRAILELSEADRELLSLRYNGQLGFAEIAATLQEPLGTVLARGHRALRKLRRKLGEPDETK